MKSSLSLILPIYNSASFLEKSLEDCWSWLSSMDRETELVLVDDASSDATPEILRAFAEQHADSHKPDATGVDSAGPDSAGQGSAGRGSSGARILLLRNEPNMGKGFSVRRGMLEASGDLRIFTDADLTYPIGNADALIAALEGGSDLAIGSRMHQDSRYVVAPDFLRYVYTRHTMGRIFNLLVRVLVVPGIPDTQAGLKGLTRHATEIVFPRGDRKRFSFDVEMLFIAQQFGLSIAQCPVRFIYKKEPSTMNFVKDTFLMVSDMLRIRIRGLLGRYKQVR